MTFFNFISVKLTLFLIIGILIGYFVDVNLLFLSCSLLGLFGLLFWAKEKGSLFFEVLSGLIVIAVGIFVVSLSHPKNNNTHYSHSKFEGLRTWTIKVDEVLKSNLYSDRYVVKVLNLEQQVVSGKVLLNVSKDSTTKKLYVDDEVLIASKLKPIYPPLNPHQFDYKKYLEKQHIYHQVSINSDALIVLENPSKTLLGTASNFREKLISKLKKEKFGEEELAVIQALLLGQRNELSESTYTDYKNAGAVHILAVSGLHVGILLLLLQFLLSPIERLPKGKTLKLIIIVVLLWCFAFIAGLSPSIIRAVTMFTFIAYAMYLNRPTNTFNIIALSMFFLLLIKPMFLFQVGFQMSYAAVFAIAWVYTKLQRFWYPEKYLVRKTWQLLSVSFAAQLGVLPISLFYFHQFPALFFVSNLLVIPFLGIILGIGVLVLFLTFLGQLPSFLVDFYNFLIRKMNLLISWVAQQEGFIFREIPFDSIQLLLSAILIISGIHFLTKPKFGNILPFLFAIIGLQVWAIYTQHQTISKEIFVVTHKTKNTILLHQNGEKLNVFSSKNFTNENSISNYKIAEHIATIENSRLKNSYTVNNKHFYIMDSLGVYPPNNPDYLLLTHSPKINIERLLNTVQPKQLIADGSNYKSYIARWKETCEKRKIPFHYTGEKGAYYLPTNNEN